MKSGTAIQAQRHGKAGSSSRVLPDNVPRIQTSRNRDFSLQRSIGNRNVSRLQNQQPVAQAKLKIGQPDDAYEREADRVARQVVRAPAIPVFGQGVSRSEKNLQRKCDSCKQEDELNIRRKPQSAGIANVAGSGHAASSLLPESGCPMNKAERIFFESRFGQDFSNVRLHTGRQAAMAAQSINARAFTIGNHIAFGEGEYNPGSVAGKKLLAHELTHTVQQQKATAVVVQRHELQRRFVDNSGGGRTSYVETADPELQPDGTYTETVLREELMPTTDGRRYSYRDSEVELLFNPDTCQVEIPYRFNFEPQAAASPDAPWICQDPPSSEAVPDVEPDRLREIAERYIAFVNFGLNHWFSLHIDDCDHPCADRHIPIVVRASIDNANPHRTIGVVNRGGRGDENTLCVGNFGYTFAVHEGGHQVLGAGDEYLETDERILAENPEAGRPERVRNDHSWMGSNDGFASFHERHFRFAQVFLEAVLAQTESGCNVSMKRLRTWG